MDDFIRDIESIQQEYDREYLAKRLNIVTTVKDVIDDTCDGQSRVTTKGDDCDGQSPKTKQVTVVKYYTVRPKEYFTDRHYDNYNGTTYQKYVKDIPPRKFYSESELRAYITLLNRWAGRTLEDDELTLLLRHITNGRHYQLVCLMDVTRQLADETMWRDIKE